MRIRVDHYHYLSYDDSVATDIKRIKELLVTMANEEAVLNEKLDALREAVSTAFTNIETSVNNAADRVITALQAADEDLSDEIANLEEMKTAVSEQAQGITTRLDAIAATPPPAETPTETETSTDSDTETSTGAGNEAGETTGEEA